MEFTPHCAGKTQGATHDTVKKQILHDVQGKCKFGNDLAESLETDVEHKTKEGLWKHLGFDDVTIAKPDAPTQMEMADCTEFAKE